MPDDPRDMVASGYDAIADRYAESIRAGRGPETYFRGFLARVLEPIPEGGTVLDLGCGAGLVTADLTTRARVVGVDISAGQLELARRNAPAGWSRGPDRRSAGRAAPAGSATGPSVGFGS